MKAKDWAVRFNAEWSATDENRDFSKLMKLMSDFVTETKELIAKRGGSINALEGAMREQEQKFKAVCRLCPQLDSFMFYETMEMEMPKEWETFGQQCMKMEERKARNNARLQHKAARKRAMEEQNPELRMALLFAAIIESMVNTDEISFLYKRA